MELGAVLCDNQGITRKVSHFAMEFQPEPLIPHGIHDDSQRRAVTAQHHRIDIFADKKPGWIPWTRPVPNFKLETGEDASTGQRGISFENLPSLAGILSNFCDRPVVDRTGLKGDLDLKLDMQKALQAWEQERNGGAPGDAGAGPRGNAITAAAQDQFGLKLVARKESVEVLIIESCGKARRELS